MRKALTLFAVFAVLVAPMALRSDDSDVARAAARLSAANQPKSDAPVRGADRSTPAPASSDRNQVAISASSERNSGTTVKKGNQNNQNRAATNNQSARNDVANRAVSARGASANVAVRAATPAGAGTTTRAPVNAVRAAVMPGARTATAARSALPASGRNVIPQSATRARAAIIDSVADLPVPNAAGANYKQCRETFTQCMDEFCANKDTQLRRCACSARLHDFDSRKQKLSNAEAKMQEFNENLLAVTMEKEDVRAMMDSTEGEDAFQAKDTSASKKLLDSITKKLIGNDINDEMSRNLSAISMPLDIDAAFDDIDSLGGASATAKSGESLYRAALPVCREMAAEVCDADGASLAESAYLMQIETDCNTVSKAYDSLEASARERTREGNALLDMARLDEYTNRNSDDILTCKRKMLDMLADNSVCGHDLSKCLDWSGKYIDPATGAPFLTAELFQLEQILIRPTGMETWTGNNSHFVQFLNAKKKYLEPATKNCTDIQERVWAEFMEDALAKIKLAQDKKLEDMRQSCTTLTMECLQSTSKQISDFDARALSIFGVTADKTANEMCNGVKVACSTLMTETTGDRDWETGVSDVSTDKTFDQIFATCLEVGKACIITNCKTSTGNFTLCEGTASVNRDAILRPNSACWREVYDCVYKAGDTSIAKIMERTVDCRPDCPAGKKSVYPDFQAYLDWIAGLTAPPNGNGPNASLCASNQSTVDFRGTDACKITERIWGQCTKYPAESGAEIIADIKNINTTVLSWFRSNANLVGIEGNCEGLVCPAGKTVSLDGNGKLICADPPELISSDGVACTIEKLFTIADGWTNCCTDAKNFDSLGNCCQGTLYYVPVDITTSGSATYFREPDGGYAAGGTSIGSEWGFSGNQTRYSIICAPSTPTFIAYYGNGNYLFCAGTISGDYDASPVCSGKLFTVSAATGLYTGHPGNPSTTHNISAGVSCSFNGTSWVGSNCKISGIPTKGGGSWNGTPKKNIRNNSWVRW